MAIQLPRGILGQAPEQAKPPGTFWAPPHMVAAHDDWAFGPDRLYLGRCEGTWIGRKDDRHHVLLAGSRAGKGRSVIIPTLATYEGSALVIDPKGELATITARRRGDGIGGEETGLEQDVFVLDPFNVVQGEARKHRARLNPLLELKADSPDLVDDADLIADALVISEERDPHWSQSARAFLKALVLFVVLTEPRERRTLKRALDLLSLRELGAETTALESLLASMQAVDGDSQAYEVVRGEANAVVEMNDRERPSVISTLRRNLKFLQSPAMTENMAASDFRLGDLKRMAAGTTVYLCLPAMRMGTHSPWLRMMVNLGLAALEREQRRPELPVLFLLEEFASLNYMKRIEDAAGQIAGFSVKLYVVLQDLNQLKALYKDRWETFLANCGTLQAFGNSDLTTLEYLSKRLGKTVIVMASRGEVSRQAEGEGLSGLSRAPHIVDLLTPDEIGRFFAREQMNQLVLASGKWPVLLDRLNYDQNAALSALLDPDPAHPLRHQARRTEADSTDV